MTHGPSDQALQVLLAERIARRRAQRLWRVTSIVIGIALGLIGWPWGIAGFAFFQFLAYATYWHSVRSMEAETGLPEEAQAALLARFDVAATR